MKLLRTKIWPWMDVWMLKWSAFLLGIAVGAYFHEYMMPFVWVIIVAAVLLAIRPSIRYFGDGE
jgi:hypothetical protein